MGFRHRAARGVMHGLAAFGAVSAALLVVGVLSDVRTFDQTRGGYDAPYADYTGTPIAWSTLDLTAEGMASRGHVVNVLVDCTSGMVHFEAFKVRIPFRPFSERALAVHRPRQACRDRGFAPEF